MGLEGKLNEASMMRFVSLEYLDKKSNEAVVKTKSGYLLATFLAVDGALIGLGYATKIIIDYLTRSITN